ncbi:hypothetical protein ACFLS1_04685 [Verrucomicrobiota bacterium]
MFIAITIVFIYIVSMLLAGVVGIFVLNVAFVRAFFRLWPGTTPVRYWSFIRQHICRKRLSLVLLRIPLGIIFALLLVLLVLGFTETRRVRSNITRSTRLVVRSGGNCHRNPEREQVLFETKNAEAIEGFSNKLSFGFSMIGMHCRCCGDMTFDLYLDEEIHYSFSLHHGKSIRIKGDSFGDKSLSFSSKRELAKWLDEKGITKKLEEFREKDKTIKEDFSKDEGEN